MFGEEKAVPRLATWADLTAARQRPSFVIQLHLVEHAYICEDHMTMAVKCSRSWCVLITELLARRFSVVVDSGN